MHAAKEKCAQDSQQQQLNPCAKAPQPMLQPPFIRAPDPFPPVPVPQGLRLTLELLYAGQLPAAAVDGVLPAARLPHAHARAALVQVQVQARLRVHLDRALRGAAACTQRGSRAAWHQCKTSA